jgi:hypothetical protein
LMEDDPNSHQKNILSINSSFQQSTSGISFNLVLVGCFGLGFTRTIFYFLGPISGQYAF